MSELKPKIWVGCLAAYNSGTLHGEWIDAHQSAENLLEAVKAMLAESPEPGAEEWGIFDYEGFGKIRVGEYESLETIAKWAEGIAKHGLPYTLWVKQGDDEDLDVEEFEAHFYGHYDSLAEFGEEIYRQEGLVPDGLEDCINWERYGQSLIPSGYRSVEVDGDGIYIFID